MLDVYVIIILMRNNNTELRSLSLRNSGFVKSLKLALEAREHLFSFFHSNKQVLFALTGYWFEYLLQFHYPTFLYGLPQRNSWWRWFYKGVSCGHKQLLFKSCEDSNMVPSIFTCEWTAERLTFKAIGICSTGGLYRYHLVTYTM